MDAHKITIKGIFNGSRKLEIPFYQRAYVWQEEQWERFLEDFELITSTKKPYFIGSIILKQGKVNTWDSVSDVKIVVDGQQRLTTLLLFFKAYCLKAGLEDKFERDFVLENDDIALSTGINDAAAFEEVMQHSKNEPIEESNSLTNIIDAFNYFLNNIDINKIDRLIILQNLEFVCIDIDEGEDEQQVFDTINSLGVKLTTAELLKNYFYSKEEIAEYNKHWVPIFEKDDETKEYWNQEFESGRVRRTLINEFFDSYFKLFINDPKYSISAEDKVLYSRSDNLFNSYKDFIKNYCNGEMSVVLDGLSDCAKLFKNTFDPSWTQKSIPSSYGIERLNVIIFGLKNSSLIPYVLFIQKSVDDENKRNEIFATLEKFIMRRIVTRESNKNYNRMFQTFISNKVIDNDDLIKTISDGSSTTTVPSDEDFEKGFMESKLYNLQAKGVLYLIETSLIDPKDSTTLLGFDKYSLEHLMPKKWRNNWGKATDEVERDKVILTLGNLAIITQSLNASIRDGAWSTKLHGKGSKPGLKACSSGLKTMTDVLSKMNWNETEIENRSTWLLSKANSIWTI